MDIIKYVWKVINKYNCKYSHDQEKARRRRQIEKGILTESNGLVRREK